MKKIPLCAALLFCVFLSVFAQGTAVPEETADYSGYDFIPDLSARGKYLTVKIAVAGPGDELYLWWGHIGLVVEDALSGSTEFFDWGVFSFDTENFFLDFAFGRLLYSCMASPAEYSIPHIVNRNRDFTLYTLDLSNDAKMELLLFAENNVKPENRNYWYHHFKDNCATRVRDIIDRSVGGGLQKAFGGAPGRFTLRQHVRRHTWFSPFWDWALNFLMGQDIDKPITVWEEMFLPSEIALDCLNFSYTDSSGVRRKLVSDVEVLNKAKGRPAVMEAPPKGFVKEILFGLLLAAALGFLRWKTFKKPLPGRYILGGAQSVLGLFFGLMGFLLFFMSFFTNHDYTYHNANLLFVNPLLLAACPLGLISAFGKKPEKRQKADRLLIWLWTIVFLGGILSIVIRFFPAFYQQNQPTQAMVIPFAFVLSAVPQWAGKRMRIG